MTAPARSRKRAPASQVILVPSTVGLAFTADRGWHLEESPLSAAEADRLCELADDREAQG